MDNHGRYNSATLEPESGERSIPGVLKDIATSLQQLIRSEIKLAKVEVTESAKHARASVIMLASGGLLGIYALGFILLASMFALELALPNWLSALIIGFVLIVGAGAGLAAGLARFKSIRAPEATMQTVKEDLRWMSEQPRS